MRKTFSISIFILTSVFIFGRLGYSAPLALVDTAQPTMEIQRGAPAGTDATVEKSISVMPPYNPGDTFNPFFGQDHAYSVTFRGNGQAVVFLRVALSNNGDVPMKELSLRFPKLEPEGIIAYQVIREKQCVRYDYTRSANAPSYQYPCLEYSEPNYADYYYGANTYKKAKTSLTTDTLTVELPDAISAQKSGAVLVYFRAFGFAKKDNFGAYNYTFETLKVDDTVRNLRVGISPDSDQVMKGAQGTVDYFRDSAPVFESSKALSAGSSFRNPSVDNAINNIGYGTINKNASNLMPLDSYKVKGMYADSWIKLYAGILITVGAVVLLVLLVLGFSIWRLFRSLTKKPAVSDSLSKPASRAGINFLISFMTSFISASVIVILIFLSFFFTRFMNTWGYYGEFSQILPIFALLLFVGLIGLFLIFPCIFVGVKRGLWWGLATFVFTLVWLFGAFVVLGFIFMGLRGDVPVRLMM